MAATYIVPADLLQFYDSNRVLELASDTGTAATTAELSNSASGPYAVAIRAIRSAASDLDMHCQQGKRYTRADLEAVITAALAAPTDEEKQKRAAKIQQVVADLTFGYLMARRGYSAQQMDALAPRYREALVVLEQLANGTTVFDLDANLAASIPKRVAIGDRVYRPSLDNRMFGYWPDQTGADRSIFGYWY